MGQGTYADFDSMRQGANHTDDAHERAALGHKYLENTQIEPSIFGSTPEAEEFHSSFSNIHDQHLTEVKSSVHNLSTLHNNITQFSSNLRRTDEDGGTSINHGFKDLK